MCRDVGQMIFFSFTFVLLFAVDFSFSKFKTTFCCKHIVKWAWCKRQKEKDEQQNSSLLTVNVTSLLHVSRFPAAKTIWKPNTHVFILVMDLYASRNRIKVNLSNTNGCSSINWYCAFQFWELYFTSGKIICKLL